MNLLEGFLLVILLHWYAVPMRKMERCRVSQNPGKYLFRLCDF